jgi:hypothetical protein
MMEVTLPSVAYIATQVSRQHYEVRYAPTMVQVRFALSSSPVFSQTDTTTDSEHFYTSVLELFKDIEEKEEVNNPLVWWNQ